MNDDEKLKSITEYIADRLDGDIMDLMRHLEVKEGMKFEYDDEDEPTPDRCTMAGITVNVGTLTPKDMLKNWCEEADQQRGHPMTQTRIEALEELACED